MQQELFQQEEVLLPLKEIKEYIIKKLKNFSTTEGRIYYLAQVYKVFKELRDPDNEDAIQVWKEIFAQFKADTTKIFVRSQLLERYSYIIVEKLNAMNRDDLFNEFRRIFAKGYNEVPNYGCGKDYLILDNEKKLYTWCEHGDMYGEVPTQKELEIFFKERILHNIGEKL